MEKNENITYGSTNVYVDLGYPDAQETFAKAQLVHAISNAIKARNMTQSEAAALMELDQPKVSKLLRGHFRGYSSDRLLHILNLLGQDVIITIVSGPVAEKRIGQISVAMAQRP